MSYDDDSENIKYQLRTEIRKRCSVVSVCVIWELTVRCMNIYVRNSLISKQLEIFIKGCCYFCTYKRYTKGLNKR